MQYNFCNSKLDKYSCVWGKTQSGNDIAKSTQHSRDKCAEQCDNNAECTAFDWDGADKKCWLSKTPWSVVELTSSANRWACEGIESFNQL